MSWRRFTFETMGTVGNVLYPVASAQLEAELTALLSGYEATFSTYEPTSELSQINAGAKALTDASALLLTGYCEAMSWYLQTDALFNPYPVNARLDLNGVVKAMAIQRCGEILAAHGLADWSVNIGGDVLVSGQDPSGCNWRIGLVDPRERAQLWAVVELSGDMHALATSGIAERGSHIWSTAPTVELVQVSVAAADILTADVLATTALAAGSALSAGEQLGRHTCAGWLHSAAGQVFGDQRASEMLVR